MIVHELHCDMCGNKMPTTFIADLKRGYRVKIKTLHGRKLDLCSDCMTKIQEYIIRSCYAAPDTYEVEYDRG